MRSVFLFRLQLMLLQTGLEIHRDNAPDNLLPFQAHMDQRYNEMRVHIEQHYGIKVNYGAAIA